MKAIVALIVVVALVVGLLYMQGTFDPGKVGAGSPVAKPEPAGDVRTAEVVEVGVPVLSEAVGTVRSRTTTRVSPQLMGTILSVSVATGDEVAVGDLLARIDDREVKARVDSAKAALSQAEARYAQAAAAFRRYTDLFEKSSTTKEQLEAVTGDYHTAKAAVEGAKVAVVSAEVVLGYAEIRSPSAGVVAEKYVEPGDLALPGKPLLVIQDPKDLRLEADVREYLIPYLSLGAPVSVSFGPPLDEKFDTVVEERATEADPLSRTFRVKAPLTGGTKAQPGNFGRLLFVTGERTALLVPKEAVRRIGQLETVEVLENDRINNRHVRTGGSQDGKLVILSGLSRGELVVVGR